MDFDALLKGKTCACGRHHECDMRAVFVERDALRHLVSLCADCKRLLLVADENTYAAAGARVEAYLSDKTLIKMVFPGERLLVPNEDAIAAVTEKMEGVEYILAVGSGVIQDLCKYISHQTGVPYLVVATAPSMDGYASNGAAMILGGMKVTVAAGVPRAILADPAVLKDAPMDMIRAGYGDIVGKYSALSDWRLGAAVGGEYFCPCVYEMTMDALRAVLPLADALLSRDEASVGVLMEALVLAGVAMSFAGNSRPASGSEHHLSHFFEITGLLENTPYFTHGIDVAYSTVLTARVRERLLTASLGEPSFVWDREEYAREMTRIYGPVAEGCMALQTRLGAYEGMAARRAVYREKEEELKQILREVPSEAEILRLLERIGLSMEDFYAAYSPQRLRDALCYAKDLKDRYSVLWLYYDLMGGAPVL